MERTPLDADIRQTFWKAFEASPFIMMRLIGSDHHAEPMTGRRINLEDAGAHKLGAV